LTYIDDQGDERTLVRPCYTILLRIFKSYYLHRKAQGNPTIGDKWTDITQEDISDYCVGPDYPLAPISPPPTAMTPPSTSQHVRDPIAEFKKVIKRDSSSRRVKEI
jgi:hypothetical protein